MSDRHLYRKSGDVFCGPVDSAQTIEVGDMVFQNTDGFADECVRRVGSRILISERDFMQWVDRHDRKSSRNE